MRAITCPTFAIINFVTFCGYASLPDCIPTWERVSEDPPPPRAAVVPAVVRLISLPLPVDWIFLHYGCECSHVPCYQASFLDEKSHLQHFAPPRFN